MSGIHKAMVAIMREIDVISKDQVNTQGSGYNFRGVDDVYNHLHAIMAKHGVYNLPEVLEERSEERTSRSGAHLIYRILKIKINFIHEDGSSVSSIVIGEGMDSGDKASNKAMSVGHKYSLIEAFLIPTKDDKDPERDSHMVSPNDPKQECGSVSSGPGASPASEGKKDFSNYTVPPEKASLPVSQAQGNAIYAIGKSKGWNDVMIRNYLHARGFENAYKITQGAYQPIRALFESGISFQQAMEELKRSSPRDQIEVPF